MNDIVKRMGKALRQMRGAGIHGRTPHEVKGEFIWSVDLGGVPPFPVCIGKNHLVFSVVHFVQ